MQGLVTSGLVSFAKLHHIKLMDCIITAHCGYAGEHYSQILEIQTER